MFQGDIFRPLPLTMYAAAAKLPPSATATTTSLQRRFGHIAQM